MQKLTRQSLLDVLSPEAMTQLEAQAGQSKDELDEKKKELRTIQFGACFSRIRFSLTARAQRQTLHSQDARPRQSDSGAQGLGEYAGRRGPG
jgi:hypothetical protein